MKAALKAHIEYLLCINIVQVQSVSGGDISNAYLLMTESERFFCKVNYNLSAFQMFQSEKVGLEAIAQTKTIATPQVLLCERLETGGLLLMEYIAPKMPSAKDMSLFGYQLAALHKLSSSESFGWDTDNFIGKLPLSNRRHQTWIDFYIRERLLPQLKLAQESKLLPAENIPSAERLLTWFENSFPNVTPSLLHGDLWSGNFLISKKGEPYLIDPAVYYGHHEMDIAMTRLFGGFNASFYKAYEEHYPEIGGEKERSEIYQLYYLLVHLNMFGTSYYSSCKTIIQRYFG